MRSSSSTLSWWQPSDSWWSTLTGTQHHGVNRVFFFFSSFQMRHFACRKFHLVAIDGVCNKYTYRPHVFLMRTLSAFLSQLVVAVVSGCSHRVTHLTPRVAQAQHEVLRIVLPKVVTSHRAMSYVTSHLSIPRTLGTCTPSLTRPTSLSSDPLLGELQP